MTAPFTSRITHEGPVFRVERREYAPPGGRAFVRDIVRHPGAVTILPVLDDGGIVFVRNYRVAVDAPLLELPAGKLERGEDPKEAAGRELEEETGYRAAAIVPLGQFFTTPGFSDERMHAFLATGLTHVGQRLEPGEEITVETVPSVEVWPMIRDGAIRDGKTIAALALWFGFAATPSCAAFHVGTAR